LPAPERYAVLQPPTDTCRACQEKPCLPACRFGLLVTDGRMANADWYDCDGCGGCAAACPHGLRLLRLRGAPAGAAPPTYFAHPGPQNTGITVRLAALRAVRADVAAVVVASVSGSTAALLADALAGSATRLVCIADSVHWGGGDGRPVLAPANRARLERAGAHIVRDYREPDRPVVLGAGGGKVWVHPAAVTALVAGMAGMGAAVAVLAASLAVEAGAVRPGARVVVVAGTRVGADTALVLRANPWADLLCEDPARRLQVYEYLCLAPLNPART